MDSVLNSIKKMLGLTEDYVAFDTDIIMHINSAFFALKQLGIGPVGGFRIADQADSWTMLLSSAEDLEGVKTYVYFKVRLAFDPPSTAFVLASIERQIAELEWRLNVQAENQA